MATKPLPSQEVLRQLLDYNPETGDFTWKPRPRALCSSDRDWRRWNSTFAGKPAFTTKDLGYCAGHLLGVHVKAHRIAWKISTGEDPDFIDHINGIRSDNRICNLRSIERADNQRNHPIRKDNISGYPGIWPSVSGRRFEVRIRNKWVGSAKTLEEAIALRKTAESHLGFHENHGRINVNNQP